MSKKDACALGLMPPGATHWHEAVRSQGRYWLKDMGNYLVAWDDAKEEWMSIGGLWYFYDCELIHKIETKEEEVETTNIVSVANYGWVCPVCGRGNSPLASTCPCVGPINVSITCSGEVK